MHLPLFLLSSMLFLPSQGSLTREMSMAVNDFTVELLKASFSSASKESNKILSPLSLSTVLAMVQHGAGGTTQNELNQVLHTQPSAAREGYKELIEHIKSPGQDIKIEFANKLFIANGFNILPGFKNMTVEDFKSDIESVDVTQGEATAETINNWVSQSTHQRIQQLLSKESITADTKMMLLNAVFFAGQWFHKFSTSLTNLEEFQTLSGSLKNVSTMHQHRVIHLAGNCSHIAAKFVHLSFKNNHYSMLVVVPDERDGLANVLNNLQGEKLYNLTRHSEKRYVNLTMPKFKFENTLPLNDLLKTMGLQNMFASFANFSGITEQPVSVSKVLQKAEIEVDENGAKASAVTSFAIETHSAMVESLQNDEALEIDADHPFLIFILDKDNAVPIFSAWIGDP